MIPSTAKKVIIIGATSGIGKEMALQYVQKDYIVGITGRRRMLLNEMKEKFPAQIFIACFDVRVDNNVEQLKALIDKMDGVDIFIYNAGYGEPGTALNPDIERRVYEINVKGFV